MTPKPKTIVTTPTKSKRYPIFPLRLRPDDKEVMATNAEHYGLGAMSDSVRVASRIMFMLDLPVDRIVKLNAKFEAEHPEALKINIDHISG